MFLAIDAGNSSAKAAVWDGLSWGPVIRIEPESSDLPQRLRALARSVERAGLTSVVPDRTNVLIDAVREAFGVEALHVDAQGPLPFRMAYRTPETLGADRLAAAAAGWVLFGPETDAPIVVIDAGTAVTLEVVTREPAYLGGAIAPGPDLLRRALGERTGQLPTVDWAKPSSPIGTSTSEAIQSGLTALFVDGLAGLLERTTAELSAEPFVVATGGWAPWLAEQGLAIDRVAPELVLDGIRILYSERTR